MKGWRVGTWLVFSPVLWTGVAQAKNVCDILYEKGMLSAEEARQCREERERERSSSGASGSAGPSETSGAAGERKPWPPGVTYKVGSGFTWSSTEMAPAAYGDPTPKPRFSAALGNRLQARYTYADRDVPGGGASSAFRIRRFKFFINGNAFYPWLQYKLQADWVGAHDSGSGSQRPDLDDAFVDISYFPFAAVQVGQYKVPFNRSELTSSGALQFVDRAITNARFSLVRDQGLTLHGVVDRAGEPWLEYAAGVFNGNGKNRAEKEDSDHMGAARLYWTPLGAMKYSESDVDDSPHPLLGIGGAYVFNVVHATSTALAPLTATFPDPANPDRLVTTQVGNRTTVTKADAEYHRATADVHAKWRGLSLLADYFFETRDDKTPRLSITDSLFGQPAVTRSALGTPQRTRQTHGINVQAGYFVVPKTIELAVRYAVVNPDGADNRQEEYRAGIGWFVWQHSLKVQADVGSLVSQTPGGPDRRDLEARTQLQVIF